VAPIRDAVTSYIQSGGSISTVCESVGWVQRGRADSTRLRVALGMRPNCNGKIGTRISQENAVKIIEAIGGDPVDYGF